MQKLKTKSTKKQKHTRLTLDVIPQKYELHLKPDLDAFVFEGDESIHLTLKKPLRSVTLHSKDLDIESVEMQVKNKALPAQKITYDEKAETATFTFEKDVPKGAAICKLHFRGILNDRMHGFYRSSFELNGEKRNIATTQFESTDARRAFPCFDEPAMKAIFDISLTVPSNKVAISNTLPIDIQEHASGYQSIRFSSTPPMSTYLAAFIVGDFESIEKKSEDGVLVRVFTTPGKKHQAEFALDCAAKTITFFNKYFAIPYPLPVIDLIAIPDFAAGAMENWGAVTYRETALLVDPEQSSTINKQWVALVIAHELAHQWFGNLVTMEWWTHLWLNEGFASYIEYLAVDHIFPSWNIWTQFLNADMRPALLADSLKHTHPIEVEVGHPSEIAAVFDAVSYSKGASIIRMLAEYLGEKNFRDGLRYYLKKHRFGNTLTRDLWQALQKVSGKPVERIMDAWTSAAGYPLLSVSENKKGLMLEQSRFFASPISEKESRDKTLWQLPVNSMTKKGRTPKSVLINGKKTQFPGVTDSWIKLNVDESGFYRTMYSKRLRDLLAEAAKEKSLPVRDRLGLIRDVFALAESGKMNSVEALQFAAQYKEETEYVVWAEIASSLAMLYALMASELPPGAFERYALELFSGIGATMDWTQESKDHLHSLLKVLVFGTLGKYGDPQTLAYARKLFATPATIPADLRGVVYNTIARHGGAKEYAALTEMYKTAPLHEEKNRIAGALGAFQQKNLLEKTLKFSLSKFVRSQDNTRMIAGVSVNPNGSELAWKFIQKHWDFFLKHYEGSRELSHLIEPFALSASTKRATELERFLKKNPAPGTERTLAQVLERIRSNALWVKRDSKILKKFLVATKQTKS